MSDLTWGLLIATKDRLDALLVCIRLAVTQTHPPTEVVVVDSSANWEMHARRIADLMASYPNIRLVYEKGAAPSLTVQRNQAIDEAQADIVFMIDDDSFMFPDCAAEIMAVYSADIEGEVAGIQAILSPEIPQAANFAQNRRKTPQASVNGARSNKLMLWLKREVFLMTKDRLFIPYDDTERSETVPGPLSNQDVALAPLFHGCRMTFRRHNITQTRFDGLLRYYCPGEDLDASYRLARTGLLLTAHRALLYHYNVTTGRIDRYKTTILSALNQAVLLARHATDKSLAKKRYWALMRRRMIAEVLKDGLSGRLSFPQLRGLLAARPLARKAFALGQDNLEDWYMKVQDGIVKR
ncbi:MAG: glycosyltransferase [Pseudomonadota bacterium]